MGCLWNSVDDLRDDHQWFFLIFFCIRGIFCCLACHDGILVFDSDFDVCRDFYSWNINFTQTHPEATRDSLINNAEGRKQDVIKQSEADKQRQINQAQGQAEAILSVARATADGTKLVADALKNEGGRDAAILRVAEEYIKQLGNMATNSDLLIVPSNVGDPHAIIATAMSVFDRVQGKRQAN